MTTERQQPTSRPMSLSLDILTRVLSQRASVSSKCRRPAVFLDRDGTINEDHGYLRHPSQVFLLPTAGEALRLLNQLDIPVVIITNQSALERGLMVWPDFESVNTALWQALQKSAAYYDALYYCPHIPDRTPPCDCRKPQPGLLLQAAFDFDLDLNHCYVVGDKRSDIEAGRACGCAAILVRTGHWENAYREIISQGWRPDYIASTLLEASQWIVSQLRQ